MLSLTTTVILLLILFTGNIVTHEFRRYKFSRSLDSGQYLPQSPCPSVFQYQNDQNGNLIGAVTIEQADDQGRVQLDIELSVGNSVQGYNGKIILAEERQKIINDIMNRKPISYKVLFPPWQYIPPKVTKIVANGKLLCSGPKIPIQMVPVLTTINLQHKLSLGVTPLISSSDPTVDSSSSNNLAPILLPQGDEDEPRILFDVRKDQAQPTLPNNIFAEKFRPSRHQETTLSPISNVNNPFNFNPSSTLTNKVQINPDNPFLKGLSTPQPSIEEENTQLKINNPFFNQRTEKPAFAAQQTSETPSTRKPTSGTKKENINEICGRPTPTNSLVVNGSSVPRGAYPWLVAIFRELENLSLSYICSGSLISDRHVVTAAHCVKSEGRRVKPNEIVCVFGKLNIRRWITSAGERMLEPDYITIHPEYEPGRANADIAVMTFADPIPFSSTTLPLCLWEGNNDLSQVVGNIGTVVGWGKDENGDISTAEPRQVRMPIVDQFECLKGSTTTAGQALVEIVSKNTFCAGFRNGSGPCNGDSGSAFLLRRNDVFYLRGIVSTALSEATHRSCNLNEYVVFTDASKYLDWLMRIVKREY